MILRKVDLGIDITDIEFKWLKDNNFYTTINNIKFYQYPANELQMKDFAALKARHLAKLRLKYQKAEQYQISVCSDYLYTILRKADFGIYIADIEFKWLTDNCLFKTIENIKFYYQKNCHYQAKEKYKLEDEYKKLRTKYDIPNNLGLSNSSPIYSILYKLNSDLTVTDLELKSLSQYSCIKTVNSIQDINNFLSLKQKYKVSNNTSQMGASH